MSLAISGKDFFNLYHQAKNRVCTSKIESNRPFLLNSHACFGHFVGKSLGIVFGLERPTFVCIFRSECR